MTISRTSRLASATGLLVVVTGVAAAAEQPGAAADEQGSSATSSISVEIPEPGALGVRISDVTLDLGKATLDRGTSTWVAAGTMPTIEVTDSRLADPGWSLSAQTPGFLSQSGEVLAGALLGLVPAVQAAADSQRVRAGDGLDSVTEKPGVLAWADSGSGLGLARLGGKVTFTAPQETPSGRYVATLTLTVS